MVSVLWYTEQWKANIVSNFADCRDSHACRRCIIFTCNFFYVYLFFTVLSHWFVTVMYKTRSSATAEIAHVYVSSHYAVQGIEDH